MRIPESDKEFFLDEIGFSDKNLIVCKQQLHMGYISPHDNNLFWDTWIRYY